MSRITNINREKILSEIWLDQGEMSAEEAKELHLQISRMALSASVESEELLNELRSNLQIIHDSEQKSRSVFCLDATKS